MGREEEIIKERERKLNELIKEGINPYPASFDKKNSCKEVASSKIGKNVVDSMFARTPYLNSKFVSFNSITIDETANIEHYDDFYSKYFVIAVINFYCRVDMVSEIAEYFYNFSNSIVKHFINRSNTGEHPYDCYNEFNCQVYSI